MHLEDGSSRNFSHKECWVGAEFCHTHAWMSSTYLFSAATLGARLPGGKSLGMQGPGGLSLCPSLIGELQGANGTKPPRVKL